MGSAAASAVPILLYHDVATGTDDPFAVSLEVFVRHMRLVAESGRTPLTVDAYVAAMAAGGLPERPVLVTFDDGYRQFPQAVDAMAEAGVAAATIYVTTDWLDQDGKLTWADAARLPEWVQVGSHSRTHPQLDVLPAAAATAELTASKAVVEERLGRSCRSFAYPHGHHSARDKALVRAAGYESAAAVKNALSHPRDDVFALARYTVTRHTPDEVVARVLEGSGAPLAWSRERVRTWGFRAYRRYAQRVPHRD